MSKMRVVALAGAVICAAVAGLMAKNLLSRKQVVQQEVIVKSETVDVLVAGKDLQMGDKLSDGLSWKAWPKDNVMPAMITRDAKPSAETDLALARVRVPIYGGEPIIDKKILLPSNSSFMSAILPKGMRAISVAISSRSSAGGFILPNDRVDVILTRKFTDKKSGMQAARSQVVISNVRVLAVNQIFKQADDGGQVSVDKGETATLELSSEQSEAIAQAESTGELSLALRSIAENEGKSPDQIEPELEGRFKNKSGDGGAGPIVVRAGNESDAADL
ncbi:Flp pilus assembly protein CpaB [Aestuariivirga litoralis]|uniref:Flp pilus assembly protein CpaB n=1 Tax=Aestuariivirga litoralis TaxID=2650924 RepID=UPI0018C68DB9|nr:Flp pilus assembly protein CpaB [Aestuariivirga litoralis]MBG1233953.1 Flp pilus assembly protein CpaB [Aestuariivirga litoralis]